MHKPKLKKITRNIVRDFSTYIFSEKTFFFFQKNSRMRFLQFLYFQKQQQKNSKRIAKKMSNKFSDRDFSIFIFSKRTSKIFFKEYEKKCQFYSEVLSMSRFVNFYIFKKQPKKSNKKFSKTFKHFFFKDEILSIFIFSKINFHDTPLSTKIINLRVVYDGTFKRSTTVHHFQASHETYEWCMVACSGFIALYTTLPQN